MSNPLLFNKFKLGPIDLQNRIVMAPMTRSRAGESRIPNDLMAEYYQQRAGTGLIITEATQVSAQGIGYPWTPGIHNEEQVEGWKKITSTVHEAGGKIFLQVFHVGRISHPVYHNGAKPVAPSAVKPEGKAFTPQGFVDFETPRALEISEIKAIVKDFRKSVENAKAAGFDGVEIHGANGYLIDQFLQDISNKRTDEYGGSIENRARFLFQILDEAIDAWDNEHIGLRLSPSGVVNNMGDSNSRALFTYVIQKLNAYNLAYLHLINPLAPIDDHPELIQDVSGYYGDLFDGIRIVNGGYNKTNGEEILKNGTAELVAYGVPFIANPDLPKRFELDAPLNEANQEKFYGGGAEGYTDYPVLDESYA
ncbi:alkene reductase [Flexithrix dorotheae]|uniref:alkene reductase n=1 Tax=Flexithrix dorotheae TaxID=70993 RepID=UPI0004777EDB|nr:alkene reductase [Flexithrix dorotheae]